MAPSGPCGPVVPWCGVSCSLVRGFFCPAVAVESRLLLRLNRLSLVLVLRLCAWETGYPLAGVILPQSNPFLCAWETGCMLAGLLPQSNSFLCAGD